MPDGRTIVFFPEGAYGPTNNCVGIGNVLRERGHRVVFIVEESFAGNLEAKGFEERLMRLGPPPAEPEVPGQFWIDFIRDTAPVFRKSTIEQLGEFIAPTWQALIDGAKYVDPRLEQIIGELEPDVDRRGQRRRVPGGHGQRPAVGADRVLQPGRAQGPERGAVLVGLRGRRPSGWPAFLGEYHRTHAESGRTSTRSAASTARAGSPGRPLGPEFMPSRRS